jgi:hypothetical protein
MTKRLPSPASNFSPREFLKARRPEKFSDSAIEDKPALDRTQLEYHLDTLTSRSQETVFENFARRLAQYEICPNLLPHTGPTGGGDSKADAETYPVADVLSLTWFSGIGREAAHERWAFAFSATKKWRPKLQSDIAKIAATGRGYTERKVTLTSRVLGCNISVEADNLSPCIELAESLLAAMEALLSTGMELFAREPVMKITVRKSDFVRPPFEFEVKEREGRPFVEISAGVFHPHKMTHEAQRGLKDKLIELLVKILAEVFF